MDRAGRLRRHAGQIACRHHAKLSRSGEGEGRDHRAQSVADLAAQDYNWTLVDLVVANRGEAIELADGAAEEAARTLRHKGAGVVVLTLGEEGAAFFSADDASRVAAPRVSAVDTVGAGDVFCGVLIAASGLGRGWREALAAATEAASASVTRRGRRFLPSREEMAAILERARARTPRGAAAMTDAPSVARTARTR